MIKINWKNLKKFLVNKIKNGKIPKLEKPYTISELEDYYNKGHVRLPSDLEGYLTNISREIIDHGKRKYLYDLSTIPKIENIDNEEWLKCDDLNYYDDDDDDDDDSVCDDDYDDVGNYVGNYVDHEKDIAISKAKTLMEFSKISSNYILFHGVGSKNLTIWDTRKWVKDQPIVAYWSFTSYLLGVINSMNPSTDRTMLYANNWNFFASLSGIGGLKFSS